jgi:hypothetical protein
MLSDNQPEPGRRNLHSLHKRKKVGSFSAIFGFALIGTTQI